ncbi:MAG: DUF111 family protein [Synergistaceae bacterium]|nr:DUF111 family protein [Synergistaceae bacterium]
MTEEKEACGGGLIFGEVTELSANIDDMTGEDLGAAMEILLAEGALDVWFEHIQMKKNRPAVKLSLLVPPAERERFAELTLRHTTTLGVRMKTMERAVLERGTRIVPTRFGELRFKQALSGKKVVREMAEYDDIRKIAADTGLPMSEIRRMVAEDEKIQTL